jgi:hypothetical protein
MNYNSLMNKPTINYRELIGDNRITEVGGITEEQFNTLLNTDLSSYYTKAQIDDLFARSYVYKEKSGSIVTFECPASVNGIDKVVSEIVAVQSGTGDPSPTNVRPISGWSAVNVYDGPTTDPQDATVYTTALKDANDQPLTCYGGQLVNENGVQTLGNGKDLVDLGSLTYTRTGSGLFSTLLPNTYKFPPYSTVATDATSDIYKAIDSEHIQGPQGSTPSPDSVFALSPGRYLYINNLSYTDPTAFKTAMEGHKILLTLATPTQIPQDNLPIATQDGTNNLWADSGDITVKALDKIIQG